MAFPMKKKPDYGMILGMNPRKPAMMGPPEFGGGKPMRRMADGGVTGGAGAEVDTPATDPAEEQGEADNSVTPDMLHYSGPDEHCSACSHFTGPTTCDRWSDPVEGSGHCEGFQAGGGMSASDQIPMGDEGQVA